ncbi:MAG: PaaI family thioesterase [Bdellovibrionales bacterium]|nr:PaaI family thioesterase [Bdellovibrionales bacterium]
MDFRPESHHEAFPGMVNGGIIGALLDCHSNWTAAYALMKQANASEPACTVTADFHVKLKAPTPSGQKIRVKAWVAELKDDRAKIEAELFTVSPTGETKLTATCAGTFVSVKPGHPAYHRWG